PVAQAWSMVCGPLQDTELGLASVKRRCRQNVNISKKAELSTRPAPSEKWKVRAFWRRKATPFHGLWAMRELSTHGKVAHRPVMFLAGMGVPPLRCVEGC
ncbi:MAG TPA: hypothetical protein VFA18_19615, partial [Gemmataceae bacterium]|nr:hypothetical protein [Gemmataceae bacterium]